MLECPICLGNVEDPCTAPCKHVYCRHCILQVLLSSPPEWAGSCPLCRTHISVYNLQKDGKLLMEPEVQSLWGCIFVQSGKIGLASYHFDSLEDCYISYAAAPSSWRLDDGNPPPERKSWTEVSYDEETRTFRGLIEWDPAFHGTHKWVYRIEFSEDFAGIIGGEIISHSQEGTQIKPFLAPWIFDWERHLSYLRWMPPPSTIFGSVYVQGVAYASVLEGVASYHFESPEDCYISYANAPETWRLDDGSFPPRQKPFELVSYDEASRTFKGTVRWREGFDGATRWDYTIVFSEDLGHISGGKVQPYGSLGFPQPPQHYGDPTLQLPTPTSMYYVRKPSALAATDRLRSHFLNSLPSQQNAPFPERPEFTSASDADSLRSNAADPVAQAQETQRGCAIQ
ncbi:unnamed protein product [Durusdinium trenchii]|uniref:RING-type domain-containing protein n=1 Tax=Durusdinium trenchii TaxID=1381693 RepID=A0ABP0N3K0_9DINO